MSFKFTFFNLRKSTTQNNKKGDNYLDSTVNKLRKEKEDLERENGRLKKVIKILLRKC